MNDLTLCHDETGALPDFEASTVKLYSLPATKWNLEKLIVCPVRTAKQLSFCCSKKQPNYYEATLSLNKQTIVTQWRQRATHTWAEVFSLFASTGVDEHRHVKRISVCSLNWRSGSNDELASRTNSLDDVTSLWVPPAITTARGVEIICERQRHKRTSPALKFRPKAREHLTNLNLGVYCVGQWCSRERNGAGDAVLPHQKCERRQNQKGGLYKVREGLNKHWGWVAGSSLLYSNSRNGYSEGRKAYFQSNLQVAFIEDSAGVLLVHLPLVLDRVCSAAMRVYLRFDVDRPRAIEPRLFRDTPHKPQFGSRAQQLIDPQRHTVNVLDKFGRIAANIADNFGSITANIEVG